MMRLKSYHFNCNTMKVTGVKIFQSQLKLSKHSISFFDIILYTLIWNGFVLLSVK
ncbi:unnamed protein product [Brugia pahangi]|uniref:Transposase n=1 Tax=Brugia pahangi TaxID=6280 RepID=A0A0N4TLK8_BRUPA|nr:unnamed protein product [Brugia pahangi]